MAIDLVFHKHTNRKIFWSNQQNHYNCGLNLLNLNTNRKIFWLNQGNHFETVV